jgi:hypothetical protein
LRAHNSWGVQTFGKRPLVFKLNKKLLARITGSECYCQTEGREVFDFKGFTIVGLRRNWDDLVVFVEVEKFELLRQVFEGCAGSINQLLIGSRELEALGLALVGDLHGFSGCVGLHFLLQFFG